MVPIGGNRQNGAAPAHEAKAAASLDIDIFDAVVDVPPEWDALVSGRSLFLSRAYLDLLELHGPPAVTPKYALVKRNGLTLAAVKANIFDVDDEMLSVRDRTAFNASQRPLDRLFDKTIAKIRNKALGAFGRRVVFCGNLFSCGLHGVAFNKGEAPDRLWPAVVECLEELRRADGSASYIVIKDLFREERPGRHPLFDHGFKQLQVEPSMDLQIPGSWHTYGDYLESLNTKYRKAARKTREVLSASGAVFESLSDLETVKSRLLHLYRQVEEHAQTRFGTLRCGYLPALSKMAGPGRFRCTVLRRGDEIIGYTAILKDGDTAAVHLIGFDYGENARAPIYLGLLHRSIEDGLALNCRTIHFGRTALEPKARLGAVPKETEVWVKHRNPLVNRAVGRLLRLVPEDRAPHREPFRKG